MLLLLDQIINILSIDNIRRREDIPRNIITELSTFIFQNILALDYIDYNHIIGQIDDEKFMYYKENTIGFALLLHMILSMIKWFDDRPGHIQNNRGKVTSSLRDWDTDNNGGYRDFIAKIIDQLELLKNIIEKIQVQLANQLRIEEQTNLSSIGYI